MSSSFKSKTLILTFSLFFTLLLVLQTQGASSGTLKPQLKKRLNSNKPERKPYDFSSIKKNSKAASRRHWGEKKHKKASKILKIFKSWFNKKNDSSDIMEYNGNEYQYFSTKKTWSQAEQSCQNWGGHLVSIHSKEENDKVKNLAKKKAWIGYREKSYKQWTWSDNTENNYNRWFFFEPNDWGWGRSENCGSTNFVLKGYWNDFNCGLRLGYVCKRSMEQCAWGRDFEEAPTPAVLTEAQNDTIIISVEVGQKSSKDIKYAIGFENYNTDELCPSEDDCLTEDLIELGSTLYTQDSTCENTFEVQLSLDEFIEIANPSVYTSSGHSVYTSRLYIVLFDGTEATKFYTDVDFSTGLKAGLNDVESIFESISIDSVGHDSRGNFLMEMLLKPADPNTWLSTFRFISSESGLPYRILANEMNCDSARVNCDYQVSVSSRFPADDYTGGLTMGFSYHSGTSSTTESTFNIDIYKGIQDKVTYIHSLVKVE